MECWYLLLCIFLTSSTQNAQEVHAEFYPYREEYIDQLVDHFNYASFGEITFKERYLIQDKWWNHGVGPIFFYTGNEGAITEFWNNTGFIFEIAPHFGALVVFGEHRFYGKSLPFGNDSFKHPYIGLLSIEQALADFAILITTLKKQLNATTVPVIAFGGSYGGMLSTYIRMKYPNIVSGSIAASAPISLLDTTFNHSFFFEDVTKDFSEAHPKCVPSIRQGFVEANTLASQGEKGLAKLSSVFRLCKNLKNMSNYHHLQGWIRNSLTNLAMFDYPYPASFFSKLPAYPVKAACKLSTDANSAIAGLAAAAGLFYNGTAGEKKCFNIDAEFVECADPTGCGLGQNSLAWDYQACTEIELPAGTNNITDMFPVDAFTPEMRKKYCQKRWGVKPRLGWGAVHFWGRNLNNTSNIVFSNGNLDPWHRGGVLQSLSASLKAVLIKGAAHHLDLRSSNPLDPVGVIMARELEVGSISQWIYTANRK